LRYHRRRYQPAQTKRRLAHARHRIVAERMLRERGLRCLRHRK
jgi:hypothetical protein